MFMEEEPIRVTFYLSDLTSCLPKALIEKMEGLDENTKEVMQYEGVTFLICKPTYRGQPRMFYVLVTLSHELPEWLRNLRCQAETICVERGGIPGMEAILPQPDGSSHRRPPDYDLRVRIQSDTWAGLRRVCKAIEGFSMQKRTLSR